jgi:hypothetical protein
LYSVTDDPASSRGVPGPVAGEFSSPFYHYRSRRQSQAPEARKGYPRALPIEKSYAKPQSKLATFFKVHRYLLCQYLQRPPNLLK